MGPGQDSFEVESKLSRDASAQARVRFAAGLLALGVALLVTFVTWCACGETLELADVVIGGEFERRISFGDDPRRGFEVEMTVPRVLRN